MTSNQTVSVFVRVIDMIGRVVYEKYNVNASSADF